MKKNQFHSLMIFGLFIIITGCTPKVLVMDRQTVLEQEAAGDWPQIEKQLTENASTQGPTPFAKTPITPKKARLYNVLNGELVKE